MLKQIRGMFRKKKSAVFFKFLLSYLLILIFPIVIGITEYNKTQNVLVGDATELNSHILMMSQDIVDRLLLEMDDLVSTLTVKNEVLNMMQSIDRPLTAEEIYTFSLLRNELNHNMMTNKLLYDIHIYFKKSNYVVTSQTSFDLSDSSLRIGNQSYSEWLGQASNRSNSKSYYNLDSVTDGDQTNKLIAYISPLPNGFLGKVDGAIIVFIDQHDIANLFQRLVTDKGGFAYIMDSQGQVIAPATAKSGQKLEPVHLSSDAAAGYSFQKINGTRMLISYSRSKQNGWTYVAALPSSVVLAKTDYIKRMILSITMITLFFGVIVALLLAYRSSKPLSELMDALKEFAKGENGKRLNVYAILHSSVLEIINNNRMLHSKMEQQEPFIQMALLEGLMKGDFNDDEEFIRFLSHAKVVLRGDRYFVVVIRLFNHDKIKIPINHSSENKENMIRGLREILAGIDHLCILKGDKAEIIVYMDTDEGNEKLLQFQAKVKENIGLFEKEYGLLVAMGIGRTYNKPFDIWRSYNEANQALDYQVFGDQHRIVWYEFIVQGSKHYYYPLDLELKLMNTVKNGDLVGLERLILLIEEHNLIERQLSAMTMKLFIFEIQGTVHKLLEQMEYGSEIFRGWSEKLERANPNDAEIELSSIKASLYRICHHISQHKKQKSDKMADEIMDIVNTNYMDSNFGLASLASHFKLSESFMSLLFKEQVGGNFSEYLEKLRLNKSCELLKETEMSINDIATLVGYNSDKTFRRAFKRSIGVQPTAYREVSL